MRLSLDAPVGHPSFALGDDEVATVVDLTCRGAAEARVHLQSGMLEVPITRLVRKGIRRAKNALHLTNLQLRAGEYEIDDMASNDPNVLGRIDLTLQFTHQFSNEDAYVAIECKRVGAGLHQLNSRYVSEGVDQFATGQYATGHDWGFMLGYVLVPPSDPLIESINKHILKSYGKAAALAPVATHQNALAVLQNLLTQAGGT